jgi:hypothetical protein
MRRVFIAVGIAVARPAVYTVRFPEVALALATTKELSTPLVGGRA